MATYDKEYIIRYVENELSPEERQQFEADLQKDAALAAELALYGELRSTLQQRLPKDETAIALRKTFREMNAKYFAAAGGAKIVPFRKYFAGIAAAAAVIVAIILLWPSGSDNYLQSLGHTEMISSTERGGNADSLLQQASEYFNNQQFDKALPLLERAVKEDSSSQLALFYRGLAQWHTGATQAARADLERVYSGGSALQYEAAFYLALSYAGEKNKAAAREWLKKIPVGSPVSDKAKELASRLEK
jgi:tetratricopeptide (TPR) repeat protein